MPRVNDNDYLFISARIHAMENRLLTKERRERMLDARSADAALKVLAECGYPETTEQGLEAMLADQRNALYREFGDSEQVTRIVDYFRIRYDYHNLKTIMKCRALGVEYQRLLSDSGRVEAKKLADAIVLGEYKLLPDDMALAAEDSSEVLSASGNSQLFDLTLDRWCYKAMATAAESSGSQFLMGYFRLMADIANLRCYVRVRRIGKGADLLRFALVDGGSIDKENILSLFTLGKDADEVFSSDNLKAPASLGKGSITVFERECDNALTNYLSSAKMVPFGDSVLVSFLAAKETEFTAIRTIVTGKAAGISADEIRERLRDSYV